MKRLCRAVLLLVAGVAIHSAAERWAMTRSGQSVFSSMSTLREVEKERQRYAGRKSNQPIAKVRFEMTRTNTGGPHKPLAPVGQKPRRQQVRR